MDTFDAEAIASSGPKDQRFEMKLEDGKANRFTVSLPIHIAIAMIPLLQNLQAKYSNLADYQKIVERWRTGRDNEGPHVLLEVNHDVPYVFHVEDAKNLWRELRAECEQIDRRPKQQRTS